MIVYNNLVLLRLLSGSRRLNDMLHNLGLNERLLLLLLVMMMVVEGCVDCGRGACGRHGVGVGADVAVGVGRLHLLHGVLERLALIAEPDANDLAVVVKLLGEHGHVGALVAVEVGRGVRVLLEVLVEDLERLRRERGAPLALLAVLRAEQVGEVLVATRLQSKRYIFFKIITLQSARTQ